MGDAFYKPQSLEASLLASSVLAATNPSSVETAMISSPSHPSISCGPPNLYPRRKGELKTKLIKWLEAHMETGACASCYSGYLQPFLCTKDQKALETVSRDCKCDEEEKHE